LASSKPWTKLRMADPNDEPQAREAGDAGGPVKTFLEHLEDLRWVLVKSAAALGVAMLLCLTAGNHVMTLLKWPLARAPVRHPGTNQIVTVRFGANPVSTITLSPEQQRAFALGTNRYVAVDVEPLTLGTNQLLGWHVDPDPRAADAAKHLHIDLINLSPAGGFVVAFQVAFYGGIILAAPFILFFVAEFVFPALKIRERKYIYKGLLVGGGLFFSGVAFCYFVLMPVALAASQLYSQWLGLGAFQWRAEEYISFVCKFMLGMGLGFELPVVILTLVKIGIVDYAMLSRGRRYMIVINLILGALLTTPEVLTQLVMFVPLQLLYEISVWIAWYWERQERRQPNG
jgi:sec-independent protein translocase protein TatC